MNGRDAHVVSVSSFTRGHSVPYNRRVLGTRLTCRCGWTTTTNEAPSGCQAWIRTATRIHKQAPDEATGT